VIGGTGPSAEPTRARYPDDEGYAERDGVRHFYEVYGDGEPTLLFATPTPFTHSRAWKAQLPYLSRHFRVLTFDCRGNGKSDRPRGIDAYRTEVMAKDVLAVMDATATERAAIVSLSVGARAALCLLASHPERFSGAVFIAPYLPLTPWPPVEVMWRTFTEPRAWRRALRVVGGTITAPARVLRSPTSLRTYARFARRVRFMEGVRKFSREYWLEDQRGYAEWLARTLDFTEPHSTKQIEDSIEWAMETDGQTFVDFWMALDIVDDAPLKHRDEVLASCSRVRCPVLVVHGECDVSVPPEWGAALAEATGGRFVPIADAGHVPHGRKPVPVNLALREFAESLRPSAPTEAPRETAVETARGGVTS
jgi:pimeloyl-ACP methyl ester carboxylesterase